MREVAVVEQWDDEDSFSSKDQVATNPFLGQCECCFKKCCKKYKKKGKKMCKSCPKR